MGTIDLDKGTGVHLMIQKQEKMALWHTSSPSNAHRRLQHRANRS